MVEVTGANGTVVRVLADSINNRDKRVLTFEWEYWRGIHSEIMTHGMLTKNAASSRAIPTKKMIEHIKSSPFIPEFIGKNQAGMRAKEQLTGQERIDFLNEWEAAKNDAIRHLEAMDALGAHKQLASRITEPWMKMKTVVSGTEWNNFLWLRDHSDAQPEFGVLARCVAEAMEQSEPVYLNPGEWHLPYVDCDWNEVTGEQQYYSGEQMISLDDALKLSASCCAQVSYRKLDTELDKAIDIYNRLVSAERVHASPFSHQASPIMDILNPFDPNDWEDGVTHVRKDGTLWSANFCGWIQHRQLIPGHTKWG